MAAERDRPKWLLFVSDRIGGYRGNTSE